MILQYLSANNDRIRQNAWLASKCQSCIIYKAQKKRKGQIIKTNHILKNKIKYSIMFAVAWSSREVSIKFTSIASTKKQSSYYLPYSLFFFFAFPNLLFLTLFLIKYIYTKWMEKSIYMKNCLYIIHPIVIFSKWKCESNHH